jgi:hypothetical protein
MRATMTTAARPVPHLAGLTRGSVDPAVLMKRCGCGRCSRACHCFIPRFLVRSIPSLAAHLLSHLLTFSTAHAHGCRTLTSIHARSCTRVCTCMTALARARTHVPAHRTHVGHACAHTHIRTHTCRARLSARAGLIHTFACTCPHTHVCAHASVFSWRLIACAVFEYSCVSSRRAVRIRSATRPMTPSLTSRSCVCVRRSVPIRPTPAPPPPPPPSSLYICVHTHTHTRARRRHHPWHHGRHGYRHVYRRVYRHVRRHTRARCCDDANIPMCMWV